jgi:hypothetical protein
MMHCNQSSVRVSPCPAAVGFRKHGNGPKEDIDELDKFQTALLSRSFANIFPQLGKVDRIPWHQRI